MSNSNIERLNSRLMALYDEKQDLKQEIELTECMGREVFELEEQLFELELSIPELERQLHDHEMDHLEHMKEAV